MPTLKFKLERETSWWQTHKLIILMIIGRTARLELEIYLETGWGVMTCYSYYKEILNSNMLNAYAVKSSLFSRNVAWCFIGQTQIIKKNLLFNLDNTPSMATLNNALQNSLTYTPFTPAKHVLLNWFSLNENYKQRTEKLDFPLDSSTC